MCLRSCTVVYLHVRVCVCVYEAANHRLIGAIRLLAEHNHIAAPDGQLEVDTMHAHAYKTHTYTYTYMHKTNNFADRWCPLILSD